MRLRIGAQAELDQAAEVEFGREAVLQALEVQIDIVGCGGGCGVVGRGRGRRCGGAGCVSTVDGIDRRFLDVEAQDKERAIVPDAKQAAAALRLDFLEALRREMEIWTRGINN